MGMLVLENVSVSYPAGLRDEVVIEDVSISIDAGEFVGVWGSRRSGKSTLLRVLAGVQRPSSGVVSFDGQDLARISSDAQDRLRRSGGIALVREWRPERNGSTVDHVARSLLCEGLSLRESRRAARGALERVGLLACADLGLQQLSAGELLRVALAIALVRQPRLLLVDEPATSRSPTECQELCKLLREIASGSAMTLLLASETPEALRGVSRMLRIGSGRLSEMNETATVVPLPRRQAS